jgi:hypothetical protein
VRVPARLGLVLLLAVAWLLPWADVLDAVTGRAVRETGAARLGGVGPAVLVVLWGLALATLCGRTRRGLQAGEAFSAAALAAMTAGLLLAGHPWITGGRVQQDAWLPIFLPLAALAALDGWTRLASPATGSEITAVRVAAALFAAGALAADRQALLAGIAGWIGAAPLAFLLGRGGPAARLVLEALIVVAALTAGFAPTLRRWMGEVREPIGGLALPSVAWSALAATVVLTGISALFAPREPDAAGPTR